MSDGIVILVNGEVLASSRESEITEQKNKADLLAEALSPIFASDLRIVVMHGNKPQVGYVLFRSELASHVLHQIPLDVCGADTQGATGYMVSQAISNVLRRQNSHRSVMPIVTQTIINSGEEHFEQPNKQIGPWLDNEIAEQRRQVYGWNTVEEPGYGYRRVVASPPPEEIVEIEGIRQLYQSGLIVIAAGGGGVPVIVNNDGLLEGAEAVVDTDRVACKLANQLEARTLLMLVEDDTKFVLSGLGIHDYLHLSRKELEEILERVSFHSNMVMRKLHSANEYLRSGGGQVIITTLEKLTPTLKKESGLWLGDSTPPVDIAKLADR
jgi:carbamate kinase